MKSYEFKPQDYQPEIIGIVSKLLFEAEKLEDGQRLPLKVIDRALKDFPKDKSELFSRDQLTAGIEYLIADVSAHHGQHSQDIAALRQLIDLVKLKPMRTQSGVTTVTVLTKPFMCPGECVFCPNDVRMPKSYIATEPGAQRALANRFSPYLQTWNRLKALQNIGHPTDKIELLVLGGTWSSYPQKYQIWFISECFRAMNSFSLQPSAISDQKENSKFEIRNPKQISKVASNNQEIDQLKNLIAQSPKLNASGFLYEDSEVQLNLYLKSDWNDELRNQVGDIPYNELIRTKEFKEHFQQFLCSEDSVLPVKEGWEELHKLHEINSRAQTRCVGLVLETRPDSINEREVHRLRSLGATKIQLGIQTLNDEISDMNKRGEHREHTARAFQLLRAGGFKIHAHMMPNLYGATPEIDREVYKLLFTLRDYKPDEVKIYPTSVIRNTELFILYEQGKYTPYTTDELTNLIADMMESTPEYCRLTRIIRDIPSTEIEAGNKTTNLREVVEHKLQKEGRANPNIRDREIKNEKVSWEDLHLDIIEYETTGSTEFFLQYITSERKIAGFLRLSIPTLPSRSQVGSTTPPYGRGNFDSSELGRDIEVQNLITPELNNCAIIREVHVYGPSLQLGKGSVGQAQHLGLGTKLIEKAKEIARDQRFTKLAVISSIGTREYYAKRGFVLENMYQIAKL